MSLAREAALHRQKHRVVQMTVRLGEAPLLSPGPPP